MNDAGDRAARGADGRHIDTSIGALQGEASGQRVASKPRHELEAPQAWTPPGEQSGEGSARTYYDRPVVKEPVWIWAVPAYFYVGGAAGAAAVLAEVVDTMLGERADGLVRRARWIGAAGGALGTALLIHDLGRPSRFLNMLRVFRPSSPMSVGSWILGAAAPAFALSAALPRAGGVVGRAADAAGKVAAALGLPLTGYTAVLVSTSAIPLWQAVRRSLPPLFVASAASSATSLLAMFDLDDGEAEVVRRFGIAAQIAEAGATIAVERDADRIESVGRPLHEGLSGTLWTASKALSAASLSLSLVPGGSRLRRAAAGVLGTAGALSLRFGVFHAGKASARDPRATFEQQRAGRGGAETSGRPAVTGA